MLLEILAVDMSGPLLNIMEQDTTLFLRLPVILFGASGEK